MSELPGAVGDVGIGEKVDFCDSSSGLLDRLLKIIRRSKCHYLYLFITSANLVT